MMVVQAVGIEGAKATQQDGRELFGFLFPEPAQGFRSLERPPGSGDFRESHGPDRGLFEIGSSWHGAPIQRTKIRLWQLPLLVNW
jgi:hypothetical protein